MANSNFPFQCPRLTKDNYEIQCIRVKAWLGSQDVWEMIEKSFEEPIDRATLTLAQRKAMQKVWRKDDTTFEIMANVTTVKQAWEVLQESNQGANNMIKVHL
jgi:hypothetical protein